jgi:hypothetical protein
LFFALGFLYNLLNNERSFPMKSRWITIFWALVMIAAGVVFMLREARVIDFDRFPPAFWAIGFAFLSGSFFLTYFLLGKRNWGWLFPATIFAALALIIGLSGTPLGDFISGAPIMLAVAIPFLVVFSFEPRKNWWALIPAWVMVCISLIILFEDRISGNFVGTFVLYSIALPFLVVYLMNRQHRWALIPFAALSVIGIIPLLEDFVDGEAMGVFVMFLFAIPFFVVYFWSKNNWWALIPAGVFASIALVVLYSMFLQGVQNRNGVDPLGTALLLTGIGLTFGGLWLRRAVHPTEWAKVPALLLLVLAMLTLVLGANFSLFWPVVLIAGGVIILLLGVLKKPVVDVKTLKPAEVKTTPEPAEVTTSKKPAKAAKKKVG